MKRRIIITLLILATPFVLGLALTYEVIDIDFLSFMEDQPMIDYQEGPRLRPAEGAIPVTGLEMPPDGSLPANPVAASPSSLARGEFLFKAHCAVCHGIDGKGDGPVAAYFQPPASEVTDLTEPRVVKHEDGLVYSIITKGFQGMPSLAENLTPRERWDVINYLHQLQAQNGESS